MVYLVMMHTRWAGPLNGSDVPQVLWHLAAKSKGMVQSLLLCLDDLCSVHHNDSREKAVRITLPSDPVTLRCFFLGLYSPLVIAAWLKISLLIHCFSFYHHKTVVHAPNVLNEDFNDEEIKLFDSKLVSGYLFIAILCFRILNVYLCWKLIIKIS